MRTLMEERKTFETRNNLYRVWVSVREAGRMIVVARWIDGQTDTPEPKDADVT